MRFERRDFLKISGMGVAAGPAALGRAQAARKDLPERSFNSVYRGPYLNRLAFPLGGIGAGMICIEGTGAFSHFSLRNHPDIFNEPCTFAALKVGDAGGTAKVLEGPVPEWKVFGLGGSGNGAAGTSFGLPRLQNASFEARFPFARVMLDDPEWALEVEVTAWSPFIPGSADESSLPVCGLEYHFRNTSQDRQQLTFSYNAKNFMATAETGNSIGPCDGGFILRQEGSGENPQDEGAFAAFVLDEKVIVDHCWFRGGWWDSLTMAWKNIERNRLEARLPVEGPAPGASLFVPFTLEPHRDHRIRLLFAWYIPRTHLRYGDDPEGTPEPAGCSGDACCPTRKFHVPWYAGRFQNVGEVIDYWRENYPDLRARSALFRDSFFDTTLPPVVTEAIAANLTILKSPTVRRQCDGRLWCFEGCGDTSGCCHGSCTHVWNYAQALPHLFPDLERSLRETEFRESQNDQGHQTFRAALPIRQVKHDFHAAADGQLGGIMKVHREWRISGNTEWLRRLWPRVKASLDYCTWTWDPKGKGVLEEPHHNTYDIEFWGPDGMCTSFYLGALTAAVAMGEALGDAVDRYRMLLDRGRKYMEDRLFNGEYFQQEIRWKDLEAVNPVEASKTSWSSDYSPEAIELLQREGPKYQYGSGCLSDGVLGCWIAQVCGLGEIIDPEKVRSSLEAIHRYNLKQDLSDHVNPQRPSYALGHEGGLLLCTWPKGGALSLPFVYSNEVWTGIEYQVASHLMMEGRVEEGLEIVKTCRKRYDGTIRNPFNEYECGHWYARAMASYGLIQGLTGVRYDAVDKTLNIESKIGDDFRAFLSVDGGFGTVGLRTGKPFLEVKSGEIEVREVLVSGERMELS
jgi:uncharacterized protein (DUF608 family)